MSNEADRPDWLNYEYIARVIPDGILAFNARGMTIYASERAAQLLGRTQDELLDRTLEELTTSDWASVARKYTQGAEKGDRSTFDFCFLGRAGEENWARISLTPTIMEGRHVGSVAIVSDISSERHVEGKLRETEMRLRGAAEHMPGLIYELSFSPEEGLRVEYTSEAAQRFTGIDAQSLMSSRTDVYSLLHPDDVEMVVSRVKSVVQTLAPSSLQFRFSSGEHVFHMYTAASVVQRVDGSIVITGVAIDIGELKRVESKLRASEAQLAAVFENFPFECWASDLETKVLLQNPASQRRWGNLRGKKIKEVFADRDNDNECQEAIRMALGGTISRKQSVALVNGQSRHFEQSFAPIRDGKEIIGALSVVVDTTEQRMMEKQLAESKKLDALGRLAGGIAHDFNNILTAIMSCVRLLERRLEGPPRSELQIIRDGAKRAAELTRQLLAFAKQEMVEPTLNSVDDILLKSDRLLRRLIGENIELVTFRNAEGWQILVDPVRLEQAIINLVVNAKDSMTEGGTIAVHSEAKTLASSIESIDGHIPPGDYAFISITDSGVGMSDDTKARAFEPFFTTRHDVGGTGLGLSSVYGSVHQAKGYVTLETVVDKGTTIGLYLPRAKTNSDSHFATNVALQKKTILLVEDEPLVRSVTFRSLCLSGYKVLQASDSKSAQEISRSYKGCIDLLLTDVVMPSGSGLALAELVRKDRPDTVVVFTSGYSREFNKLASDEFFLPKPFTPEKLEDLIARALSRRQ